MKKIEAIWTMRNIIGILENHARKVRSLKIGSPSSESQIRELLRYILVVLLFFKIIYNQTKRRYSSFRVYLFKMAEKFITLGNVPPKHEKKAANTALLLMKQYGMRFVIYNCQHPTTGGDSGSRLLA